MYKMGPCRLKRALRDPF